MLVPPAGPVLYGGRSSSTISRMFSSKSLATLISGHDTTETALATIKPGGKDDDKLQCVSQGDCCTGLVQDGNRGEAVAWEQTGSRFAWRMDTQSVDSSLSSNASSCTSIDGHAAVPDPGMHSLFRNFCNFSWAAQQ